MPASDRVESFARELGLSRTIAAWLLRAGHGDVERTRRFFTPRLAELSAPDAMLDRDRAAQRLVRAVRQGEHIVVFGDYDCDGITATAILTEALRALGGKVTPQLANRFAGGYGLSPAALQRIEALAPGVVVTCDCGSSDHATLAVLQAKGVDAIVIDHHLVPPEPLPALAFLNPNRPECGFPYKGLASCGLALSVVAAVRSELGVDLDLKTWLDLVAIGTIADVAPLTGDNRALVRSGLQRLARAERPGVQALLDLAKVEPGEILSAREVAFRLAPRLNAPGRLGAPDLALELLIAKDASAAGAVAADLEQISAKRKRLQQAISDEALTQIENERYHEQAAIVLGDAGWNPGIVGIVAGRLAERYRVPVIVCGVEGGVARGSVRGPRGYRLHDALSQVQALLIRFGGHQAAAGLELSPERIPELRAAFVATCERTPFTPAGDSDEDCVELDALDDPLAILTDLDRLEPCGEGNPRPKIKLSARVVRARAVKGGHLKLELELPTRRQLGCFWPGEGDRADALLGRSVSATGEMQRNRWSGGAAAELLAEQLVVRA